jgi:hypothetical protein
MDGRVFVPAGNFDDDLGVRPLAHIFVASKAPWFEIRDQLSCFDTYPEGIDAPVLSDREPLDPPGRPRGSCLCGSVTYVVEGSPVRCWNCHCGRCRRARSAAFASNLFTGDDGLRFTRGQELLTSFKVPEAQRFTHIFCRIFAVVPMGSLDDDPGMHPQAHIFVSSMAPWYTIMDDLPQYAEYPTG